MNGDASYARAASIIWHAAICVFIADISAHHIKIDDYSDYVTLILFFSPEGIPLFHEVSTENRDVPPLGP